MTDVSQIFLDEQNSQPVEFIEVIRRVGYFVWLIAQPLDDIEDPWLNGWLLSWMNESSQGNMESFSVNWSESKRRLSFQFTKF